MKEVGEKPIPESDPIFRYAAEVGISPEMLAACWSVFKRKQLAPAVTTGKLKSYADWRATFRNAVRENWYELWFMLEGEDARWTTKGEQARRVAT